MKPTNSSFQLKIASVLLCLFVSASIPALAATTKYAVGTCQPKLQQFPTIAAAISAVPPSSIILVCPGSYPEQINLYQPVTLQGVASGGSGQAIITVPPGGLTQNAISIDGENLYAQVVATSTGVNISNLTVDGSNNNLNGAGHLAGIFYQAASSGTINEVTARNQINAVYYGIGIWIENGTSTPQSITVQNSSVHDVDFAGIYANGSNLTANIKGNSVQSNDAGIIWTAQSGLVSGNVITVSNVGIDAGTAGTFSQNTISGGKIGIAVETGASTVTGNKIFHTIVGISMTANGQTLQSNVITNSIAGFELYCTTGHVISRNTINDATFGLYLVPSAFTGTNSFLNVGTLRVGGCNSAQTKPAALAFPTPLTQRTR